jgi:carboxypeptidase C (cathepsin A)
MHMSLIFQEISISCFIKSGHSRMQKKKKKGHMHITDQRYILISNADSFFFFFFSNNKKKPSHI